MDVSRSSQCAYCGKTFGAMGQTLRVHCKECTRGTTIKGQYIDIVWCTKTCAKKDESHSSGNKFLTCPGRNKDWNAYILILRGIDLDFWNTLLVKNNGLGD